MIRALRKDYDNVILYGGHPKHKSWHKLHVAAPTPVQVSNSRIRLYFRGQDSETSGALGGIAFNPLDITVFDGFRWDFADYYSNKPFILPGSDLDGNMCVSGSPVKFKGQIYYYYRGVTINDDGSKTLRPLLAVSTDAAGTTFDKKGLVNLSYGTNMSCAVVDDRVYALVGYDVGASGAPQYRPRIQFSTDGINFSSPVNTIMLGDDGEWDSYSMSTWRLFYADPYLYIVYAASDKFRDYNEGFGIARSHKDSDFHIWEKYHENPIFIRGSGGSWDEGGLWSPQLFEYRGGSWIFYEGAGTGTIIPGGAASALARSTAYGGYADTSFSHICVAAMNFNSDKFAPLWYKTGPYGNYFIRNVATGMYLTVSEDTAIYQADKAQATVFTITKSASGSFIEIAYNGKKLQIPATRKPYASISFGTPTEKEYGEWFIYENACGLYKLQNRYSGLFLHPYADNLVSGVEAGTDIETNVPTMWHQFVHE